MHLLYVDESGNPDGKEDRYFVLGGVAVFEREVYWINEQVNQLAGKYFPNAEIEFHAQAIASHRDEPWHSCPTEHRNQIVDALCGIISSRNVVLFGIAIEKAMTTDPVGRAFEEICNRCDLFMRRLHAQGNTQRALIIFDESRYETSLHAAGGIPKPWYSIRKHREELRGCPLLRKLEGNTTVAVGGPGCIRRFSEVRTWRYQAA